MPIFICRWQNGDFSAVSARNREEAFDLLDEVGNPDAGEVFTVKNFAVHFRLKRSISDLDESLPVHLEGFGEGIMLDLPERLYPVYDHVCDQVHSDLSRMTEIPQDVLKKATKKLNEALVTERLRQWDQKKPRMSDDPEIAEVQKQLDMPKTSAEAAVKERRRRILLETPPNSGKVQ